MSRDRQMVALGWDSSEQVSSAPSCGPPEALVCVMGAPHLILMVTL